MNNLFYDKEYGELVDESGNQVGWCERGYTYILVDGKRKKASRVIWEMHNGKIPDGLFVDHINNDRSDDRIENLRLVTPQQNVFNRKVAKNSKSGYKGIFQVKDRNKQPFKNPSWKVSIQYTDKITGKRVRHTKQGFRTPEEAANYYDEKALEFHGEYACLNFESVDNSIQL